MKLDLYQQAAYDISATQPNNKPHISMQRKDRKLIVCGSIITSLPPDTGGLNKKQVLSTDKYC